METTNLSPAWIITGAIFIMDYIIERILLFPHMVDKYEHPYYLYPYMDEIMHRSNQRYGRITSWQKRFRNEPREAKRQEIRKFIESIGNWDDTLKDMPYSEPEWLEAMRGMIPLPSPKAYLIWMKYRRPHDGNT